MRGSMRGSGSVVLGWWDLDLPAGLVGWLGCRAVVGEGEVGWHRQCEIRGAGRGQGQGQGQGPQGCRDGLGGVQQHDCCGVAGGE